jgi:hypothetical protein
MRSDIAIDPDFQILELSQKPYTPIIIFNIYNAKDTNNTYTLDKIKLIPVPQTQNAIYTGDWNLHHATWSLDRTTRGQASHHKEWIDNNGLTLINTPKTPTWQSKTGQQSTIDLTFINETTLNNAIIKNWRVNHELSFTTDNFPITWDIDQGKQYINEQPSTS